jgi:hypothetical protein
MINTKLQNIIDTKSAIGNAIVNKGGTITSETPFFNYAAQIDGISTGGGAYSTWVAQAQDNSKYTVYNGYDFVNNPTPNLSNNFAFNRWLLNNSATGDIILSNVVLANGGTFGGPNPTFNIANMAFVNNTANFGQIIRTVGINNSFIYVGGDTSDVKKYHQNNLVLIGNVSYGGQVTTLTINNGFIYVGGGNQRIRKFFESNLANASGINISNDYGGQINSVTINNGFIYAGGDTNRTVQKFYEDNLAFVGNTVSYGGDITSVTTNNGFIYVGGELGGFSNGNVKKYHESNLALVGNTVNYGGAIISITTNDGFIYVGGYTNQTIQKFNESDLARAAGTNVSNNYGGAILSITINDGFIYAGGLNSINSAVNARVQKFYESNLAFVGNTVNYSGPINTLKTSNRLIYVGGRNNSIASSSNLRVYNEQQIIQDNQTYYTITNIKE